jgi:polysaccharide export outer membrane protein
MAEAQQILCPNCHKPNLRRAKFCQHCAHDMVLNNDGPRYYITRVIKAGGLTVRELEEAIANKLKADYLQDPQVSVFVKEYTSQRVTLEGAVKKPGIYPLSGRTTLLQAIATGGGLDTLANLEGVVIFRMVDGKKMAAVFDMKAIRSGQADDPQVFGDDVIVVDQSGSKTALRRFIESIPAFTLFFLL